MTTLRILIFAHDNQGLSSTSRAIEIATAISRFVKKCSILLLTDVPIIGKLKLPERLDYVHLPTIARRRHEGTLGPNLNIEVKDVLKIRRKIAQSTFKTFKPDLFLIDCHPIELPEEMERTLSYVSKEFPRTKVVWGLPDTIGDDDTIRALWNGEGGFGWLARICDEIWVYGSRHIFDFQTAYGLGAAIADKLFYTGYLGLSQRSLLGKPDVKKVDSDRIPLVLVAAGSGSRGHSLIDHHVSFIERQGREVPFKSIIMIGPSMSSASKNNLQVRISELRNVALHRFSKRFHTFVHDADLVVWTGGYNLLCAIMAHEKKALLIPEDGVCHDHISRAAMLQHVGFCESLALDDLTPQLLGRRVLAILHEKKGPSTAFLATNGLDKIIDRIKRFSRDRGSHALPDG